MTSRPGLFLAGRRSPRRGALGERRHGGRHRDRRGRDARSGRNTGFLQHDRRRRERVYFTTCTPLCSLWRSDGTAAGTVPLVDIMASSLATIGTTLYFTENGQELWKSDGTPPGTLKFADVPTWPR